MPASATIAERVVVTMPLDPYLPLKALSGYCGISVRKLRAWTTPCGPCPAIAVGRKLLRRRRAAFDAWIVANGERRPLVTEL